jgi:hypothetical protein
MVEIDNAAAANMNGNRVLKFLAARAIVELFDLSIIIKTGNICMMVLPGAARRVTVLVLDVPRELLAGAASSAADKMPLITAIPTIETSKTVNTMFFIFFMGFSFVTNFVSRESA